MTVPHLKKLCDFFDVDRTPGPEEKVDKDVLIERLLDFLSNPHPKYTSVGAKDKKAPSKKKGKSDEDDDDDDDDDADDDDGDKKKAGEGKMPTDKELRKWVKAYVACHDMNTATTKHALEVASGKFGVDMKAKKKTIKLFLTEEC
jgi:DEK C terminal domain